MEVDYCCSRYHKECVEHDQWHLWCRLREQPGTVERLRERTAPT